MCIDSKRKTNISKVMKANEAPEKLYFGESDKGILDIYSKRESENEIEYTSTDAFIEKAEEFIYSALNDGIMGTANIEDFMRLFNIYMKEE